MSDELAELRRVKQVAAELVALEGQREGAAMDGDYRKLADVNQRFFAKWGELRQAVAA